MLIKDKFEGRSVNREWHKNHQMPRNPTAEQRMKWHIDHSKECGCRPIPAKLQDLIYKRQTSYGAANTTHANEI